MNNHLSRVLTEIVGADLLSMSATLAKATPASRTTRNKLPKQLKGVVRQGGKTDE